MVVENSFSLDKFTARKVSIVHVFFLGYTRLQLNIKPGTVSAYQTAVTMSTTESGIVVRIKPEPPEGYHAGT